MRRLWWWLGAGAIGAVIAVIGCGDARPPVHADVFNPPPPDNAQFSDASNAPPSCNIPQPTLCNCVDVPLLTDAPNLYFVLDRSGSMHDSGKWDSVRTTVQQIVRSLGPRANFGVAIYPSARADDCYPGYETMPTRAGDSPPGAEGATMTLLKQSMNVLANGGTPTGPTLRGLQNKLTSLSGRTYVLLATDGAPNCNDTATCDVTQCMPNIEDAPGCPPAGPTNCCTDPRYGGGGSCIDPSALAAVRDLAAANIPTYVIGVPGSAPYAKVLDDMAVAGGTARAQAPFYYRIDSTDQTAFLASMREIAAKIVASCTLPVGEVKDPGLLNVYFDEQPVPYDGKSGWTIDGTTITLNGVACDKVLTGQVLDVRVIGGCPTIIK